jgi:hypothetical protein
MIGRTLSSANFLSISQTNTRRLLASTSMIGVDHERILHQCGEADLVGKVLSAMRDEFGGHVGNRVGILAGFP